MKIQIEINLSVQQIYIILFQFVYALNVAFTPGLVLLSCIQRYQTKYKEKSTVLLLLISHLSFSLFYHYPNVASRCLFSKYLHCSDDLSPLVARLYGFERNTRLLKCNIHFTVQMVRYNCKCYDRVFSLTLVYRHLFWFYFYKILCEQISILNDSKIHYSYQNCFKPDMQRPWQ